MSRTRLDAAVGVVVAAILFLGVGAAWQTYRQAQAHGEMMGHGATFHGPHPLWILFGAFLVAGAVGGIYWLLRDQLPIEGGQRPSRPATGTSTGSDARDQTGEGSTAAPAPRPATDEPGASDSSESGTVQRPPVLDVLPEDERRILEPVVASPGLTQIELRDRSDFSKSKVSQTVTGLEKRGLLYRERQGRTYRVYPADDLDER